MREIGDPYVTSSLHAMQGKIAQAQGEHERTIVSYRESLARAVSIQAGKIIGACLLGMAQEALAADHVFLATRLLAAATRHLNINRQLAPGERAMYERILTELRERLDAATFLSTWAEGEAMQAQQALSEDILHQQSEALPRRPHSARGRGAAAGCAGLHGCADRRRAGYQHAHGQCPPEFHLPQNSRNLPPRGLSLRPHTAPGVRLLAEDL